jgi:uridine kinase
LTHLIQPPVVDGRRRSNAPPPGRNDDQAYGVDLVAIAGASGAGKTKAAHASGVQTLGLDAFFKDGSDPEVPRRRGRQDWEDIRSYRPDDAARCVIELLRGNRSDVPVYDFLADECTGFGVVGPFATPFLIEGTFAFEVADLVRRKAPAVKVVKILLRESPIVEAISRVIRDRTEQRQFFLASCRDSLSLALDGASRSQQRWSDAQIVTTRRHISDELGRYARVVTVE